MSFGWDDVVAIMVGIALSFLSEKHWVLALLWRTILALGVGSIVILGALWLSRNVVLPSLEEFVGYFVILAIAVGVGWPVLLGVDRLLAKVQM